MFPQVSRIKIVIVPRKNAQFFASRWTTSAQYVDWTVPKFCIWESRSRRLFVDDWIIYKVALLTCKNTKSRPQTEHALVCCGLYIAIIGASRLQCWSVLFTIFIFVDVYLLLLQRFVSQCWTIMLVFPGDNEILQQ